MREVASVDGLAAQQVAAVIVDQRERVDAGAIACAEPALEVDRDDVIGLAGVRQRLAVGRCPAAFLLGPGEPFQAQNLADRRRRGRTLAGLFALEQARIFSAPPQRVFAADLENAAAMGRGLLGVMERGSGAVREPGGAVALVALDPFVADAALNAVAAAQLGF